MPREQFIRKQTTLLFKGKASDFGKFSKELLRHRELVNHQVMIVSSGVLAAGEYKVRFIPVDDSALEATVDSGETLVMTAKDSAIATFVGMIKGIHLEVSTPLSGGETISAVLTSYTKVYPADTAYISTLIADGKASNVGGFSAMPIQHKGSLYHQVALVSSGVLAAGAYSVKIIPDVDETLETSVDIGVTLDIAGSNSAYAQFIGVCKGIHLDISTGLTAGETISMVWSSASEQFDTMILAAIGGTTDHFMLTNIGSNTHVQIDSHIADGTIHFTEASIDHLNIQNIGTNSHAEIDTHMAIAVEADAVFSADERVLVSDGTVRKTKASPVTIDQDGNIDNVQVISFDIDLVEPAWEEGLFFYDKDEHAAVMYLDEERVKQQLGRELYVRVYNNTGVTIPDGSPVSVVGIGGDGVLWAGLTDASNKQSALRYLGLVTHPIEHETYGYVAGFGFLNNIDTSPTGYDLIAGSPIWADPANPGRFVQVEPDSPAWNVRCGGCAVTDAVNGVLFSRPAIGDNIQSSHKFFNGAILEPITITVDSDGATITCHVIHGDSPTKTALSAMFDGEFRLLDYTSSTLYEIALTAGTDVDPVRNWVYFLDSSNTLEVSLSGFPEAEQYVPVADVLCQSPATAQTDGLYKVHVWTDHLIDDVGHGHLAHINEWIRNRPAQWVSGVVLTASEIEGSSAATIDLSYTSGICYQLHPHVFPAINTTSANTYIYVVNHATTPYTPMDGLNNTDLAEDANGDSLNNKVYSLVIWGVISEDSGDCQLYANLPNGFYTTTSGGISDSNSTADYSVPTEFLGTGFLINRLVMKNSGGNVQIVTGGTFDLRGTFPAATGGGVAGGAGVTLYTQLLDTDASYAGLAGGVPIVNGIETGLEIALLDHDVHLQNVGSNSHAQIDTHLALVNEHVDWIITGVEVIHADRYTDTTYVNSDWDHDQLTNFLAAEHIDWALTGVEVIHADRYTDTDTTYVNSDWDHDQLTNYVANEHLDWTADLGAVNLHENNSANGVLALISAEILQLANINNTIIGTSNWTAVAALTGINTGDNPGIVSVNVSVGSGLTELTASGSVSLGTDFSLVAEKSGALVGSDRLIGASGSTNFNETISGIPLSIFDNDAFVDLTTNQTVAGEKTWSDQAVFNGNVGIGTTDPQGKLHVFDSAINLVAMGSEVDLTPINYYNTFLGNNAAYSITAILKDSVDNCDFIWSDTSDSWFAGFSIFGSGRAAPETNAMMMWNGTADGSIIFKTSAGNAMAIDSAGKVGIGVSSPLSLLHVRKSDLSIVPALNDSYIALFEGAAATNAYLPIIGDNTKRAGFRLGNPAKLDPCMVYWDNAIEHFAVRVFNGSSNIDVLTVTKNSKVGIGTTTPDATLQVVGNAIFGADGATPLHTYGLEVHSIHSATLFPSIVLRNKTNGTYTPGATLGQIEFYGDDISAPAAGVKAAIRAYREDNLGGIHGLYFTTSDASSNDVERMRIDSAGNVGIGTTAPAGKLHIKRGESGGVSTADLTVEGDGGISLQLLSAVDGTQNIKFGDPASDVAGRIRYSHSANFMSFNVNSAERMRIDSVGSIVKGGASGPLWAHGTGTPEGVVTAPVGSFFSRTDGGAGTSFYVKESGTGNTGWVAK